MKLGYLVCAVLLMLSATACNPNKIAKLTGPQKQHCDASGSGIDSSGNALCSQ